MTFGLTGWLKSKYSELDYDLPIWYPSRDKVDGREWLVTNGLGGYSMGTVSGANKRRYHAVLVSSIPAPNNRHIILSRVDEVLTLNGQDFELSTNHWTSGVVSPTGFKFLESFTTLPVPTWVFEINGNYLVKQLVHRHGKDEVVIGYNWISDSDNSNDDVTITLKFLVGFRQHHKEVSGSSEKKYAQFVSPNQSVIILDDKAHRLCLTWSDGFYESHRQWWWDYRWPTESIRGLPETEDLYLVGSVSANIQDSKEFAVGASFETPVHQPDCSSSVIEEINRQSQLIEVANLDNSQRSNMLLIACDQFLVSDSVKNDASLQVIEGYPWYNDGGRASLISLPGLTLATRRFDDARRVLKHYLDSMENGIIPNHSLDYTYPDEKRTFEYEGADITLWWGWALYHYWQVVRDNQFLEEVFPKLLEVVDVYTSGSIYGVYVDEEDALLRCADRKKEFTWMDAKVEGIPITPRPGKAVEMCALWYNFLETIKFLNEKLEKPHSDLTKLDKLSALAKSSMQKFWNEDRGCLHDVIEIGVIPSGKLDDSVRCNQILPVSLPFRAFSKEQEKSILNVVESELLTPMGIRSLESSDRNYQGVFGCGLQHPDQYHRDLCRHQGTAWPWLLGQYCDAVINVFGRSEEIVNRIRLTTQPMFDHFIDEDCLGSLSEMFDGNRPHIPRGCPVYSLSVAEAMRWHRWVQKQ